MAEAVYRFLNRVYQFLLDCLLLAAIGGLAVFILYMLIFGFKTQ